MMFAKRLCEGVREARITCSVRIWTKPHVRVGGIYPVEGGHIVAKSVLPISFEDITRDLARRSGFDGVDRLKVAKHGPGRNVYLIVFQYIPPSML